MGGDDSGVKRWVIAPDWKGLTSDGRRFPPGLISRFGGGYVRMIPRMRLGIENRKIAMLMTPRRAKTELRQ